MSSNEDEIAGARSPKLAHSNSLFSQTNIPKLTNIEPLNIYIYDLIDDRYVDICTHHVVVLSCGLS